MEFSNLGKHCACSDCNLKDFLPFTCDMCDKDFCLEHRTYEAHKCEKYKTNIVTHTKKIKQKKNPKCVKCKTRDKLNIKCNTCKKYTCISHRHSHICVKPSINCRQELLKKIKKRKKKKCVIT